MKFIGICSNLMVEIFNLSIKDFLTKKFITLSFLPLILSLILLGWAAMYFGNEFYESLEFSLSSGELLNKDEHPFIAWLLAFSLTKWLIGVLFYTLGAFFVIILSLGIALVVVGFLTPIATKEVANHYQINTSNLPSFGRVMALMTKEFLIFLLIFVISLLFLLLPVINIFVLNVPLFYLYYKFMLIDVASNTLNRDEFKKFYKKGGGYKFTFTCFVFYLISLIPLAGLFLQLFFVIFLSHIVYRNQLEIYR